MLWVSTRRVNSKKLYPNDAVDKAIAIYSKLLQVALHQRLKKPPPLPPPAGGKEERRVGPGRGLGRVVGCRVKDAPEQQQKRTFLSANIQMVFSMATDA